MRFVVLGAGLSGLSVSVALARGGHEVVCLEREAEVGGLARSVRTQGYTFDYGPHYLFGERAVPMISRLAPGLALAPVRRDMERMLFAGRYFKFPFQPKDLLLHMHRSKLPGVLLELVLKRLAGSKGGGGESLEDWVIESVGRRLYDYISLSGYIEKLYGLPAKRVSREWGIQKLKFLARWRDAGLLSLASRAWGEERRVKGFPVSYPPEGIDGVAKGLATGLAHAGGQIVLGAEVAQVDSASGAVALLREGRAEWVEADFIISTLPLTTLVGLLSPAAPAQVREGGGAAALRFRSVALLFIMLGEPEAIAHHCIYFTEPGASFRRITEFRRLSAHLAPQGKTSLCVEITFAEGDRVSGMDDRELFELAASELTALGLFRRQAVSGYEVKRLPFAYPVYELGYGVRLEGVLNYLAGVPGLLSLGRQGLFHYNTMANSIVDGYEAGERLGAAAGPEGRAAFAREVYGRRLAKYGEAA